MMTRLSVAALCELKLAVETTADPTEVMTRLGLVALSEPYAEDESLGMDSPKGGLPPPDDYSRVWLRSGHGQDERWNISVLEHARLGKYPSLAILELWGEAAAAAAAPPPLAPLPVPLVPPATRKCFPMPPSLGVESGARLLVLGMGGGCDVFAAFAIAQLLRGANPQAEVIYANCISPRALHGLIEVREHLFRFHSGTPVPLEPPKRKPSGKLQYARNHGTVLLEQSLPRAVNGSPFLLVVPHKEFGASPLPTASVEELTAANETALLDALTAIAPEMIFAVDCGGDAITGGVDFCGDVECGRDRQVMRALHASGVPTTLLVLGPGCDAESSVARMQRATADADAAGMLLGTFDLASVVDIMAPRCATLKPQRTPRIMQAARRFVEENPRLEHESMVIERHGHVASVPRSWLCAGLAISLADLAWICCTPAAAAEESPLAAAAGP